MTKIVGAPPDTSSPDFRARAERRRATWSIACHHDLAAMKTAEYAYWARQPTHAVMTAVSEMTAAVYAMNGIDVPRLQRSHRAL